MKREHFPAVLRGMASIRLGGGTQRVVCAEHAAHESSRTRSARAWATVGDSLSRSMARQ